MELSNSNGINKLAAALVQAHAAMPDITKDRVNPFIGNKYAGLPDIIDSVRPVLKDNGLAVMQFPISTGVGMVGVRTILIHESGEFISEECSISVEAQYNDKGNAKVNYAQLAGAAITYLRRYALCAVLQLATDEDNDASQVGKGEKPKTEPPPGRTKPVVPDVPVETPPVDEKPILLDEYHVSQFIDAIRGTSSLATAFDNATHVVKLLKEKSLTPHDSWKLVGASVVRCSELMDKAGLVRFTQMVNHFKKVKFVTESDADGFIKAATKRLGGVAK